MPIIRTGFTYSGRADQPGEFCYNFSQMTLLRWLTFLLRSQTVILTILLFCIYFFLMLIFCSTMVFPPLFISLILLLSQFPLTFHEIHNRMPCFIARLLVLIGAVFMILWEIPLECVFKLIASTATNEFCELVQVGIVVYIPHRKYQVKPHSSLWFLAACTAAISS